MNVQEEKTDQDPIRDWFTTIGICKGNEFEQIILWNSEHTPQVGDSIQIDGISKPRSNNGWYRVVERTWNPIITTPEGGESPRLYSEPFLRIIVEKI